jgi:hypothetical protein
VTDFRVTQEGAEVVADFDPSHRITQEGADVVIDAHPPHRITLLGMEVVRDNRSTARSYIPAFIG